MPEISVIIPVYNTEQYLPRCIDSVLAQTFRDFELILVDDGSPDSCGAICDSYAEKDSRIKVAHQEHAGVSAARNRGMEIAEGKYIVFVDSDDYVRENYLLDLSAHDADFVSQSFSTFDENGRFIKTRRYEDAKTKVDNEHIKELLEQGALGYMFSKRFKTALIKENGIRFDESISHSEDTLFIVDYLKYARSVQLDENDNYCYVRYSSRDTLSNRMAAEGKMDTVRRANELICRRLTEYGSEEYEALYYARIAYDLLFSKGYLVCQDVRGAGKLYRAVSSVLEDEEVQKALRYSPDAIWKLPVHPRIVNACIKKNKSELLLACAYSEAARRKNKTKQHG